MSRSMTMRPSVLAACAGRACACVLVSALSASAAAQDRDPFDTSSPAGNEVQVSEYLTVDLHVQDEDLANVLQMLSIQSERNVVMSSDISASVTADLYNVTFKEALDAILNVNGYGYVEKGNFIYVYTLEEIAQIERANRVPVSKVIQLDYLNANDASEFCSPLLSEIGQIKTNGDVDAFNVPDEDPVGDEQFALSATMVVFDYPEHVEEIEKLIKQLDTRPAQVLVEATILQTSLTEANAFGVDFSFLNNINFTDFINVGGPLGATNALIKGGTGAQGEGVTPLNNHAISGTSSVGNTAGAGGFKVGLIQDDFSVFLKLLDEVSDTTVLANPKILAVNRAPSRVLIGRRVGFLNTTSTQTSTTQTVDFLDTGTQLSFRPFISTNGDIRMELNPSVSEGVIREATDATGASVTIPDEITQELTTNVIVRDGSTIVLGGLFKETTVVGRRQVPIVGDLPIIGAAFRGHDDSTDRAEIIFMITPTIMKDDVLIEQGRAGMEEVTRVRTGARNGLLPWSRSKMSAKLNVEAERMAANGDLDQALWKLRRSLNLNRNQPEAIQLREQILGKRSAWPARSMLSRMFNKEIHTMTLLHPDEQTRTDQTTTAPDQNASAPQAEVNEKSAAVSAAISSSMPNIETSDDSVASESAQSVSNDYDAATQQQVVDDLKLTATVTPGESAPVEKPRSAAPSHSSSDESQSASASPVIDEPSDPDMDELTALAPFIFRPRDDSIEMSSEANASKPLALITALKQAEQTAQASTEPIQSQNTFDQPLLGDWFTNPMLLAPMLSSATSPTPPMTNLAPTADTTPLATIDTTPILFPSTPAEYRFLIGDRPIQPRIKGFTITSSWRSLQDIFGGKDQPAAGTSPKPTNLAGVDPDKD